jgi:hypothetical protein
MKMRKSETALARALSQAKSERISKIKYVKGEQQGLIF